MPTNFNAALACTLCISLCAGNCLAQNSTVVQDPFETIRSIRSLAREKQTPATLISLALAYFDVRQFRLFELTIKEAMLADPLNPLPNYYLGRYQLSIKDDIDSAQKHFEQAVALAPGDFRSLYFLGYCDELQARLAAAEERYAATAKLVDEKKADFPLVFEGLARLQLAASNPSAALPWARKAAIGLAAGASAYRTLAKCLTQLKRDSEAAEALETAARLDPSDAPTLYSLFRALRATGQAGRSDDVLRQFKRVSSVYASH
jgi:tetratricopeptide (TPR) repeat protein